MYIECIIYAKYIYTIYCIQYTTYNILYWAPNHMISHPHDWI